MRRTAARLSAVAVSATAVLALAWPARAVPADKQTVLAEWTQTGAASYDAWYAARRNQAAWAAYDFDWSTDYCSGSPDNPLGFPFGLSCARHDFGYRNYKAAGTFEANKARLDGAFYADLLRVCTRYAGVTTTTCNAAAWTYYQAVRVFG